MKSVVNILLPLTSLALVSSESPESDVQHLQHESYYHGPTNFMDSNITEELFKNASQNPNATRSVKFRPSESRTSPRNSLAALPEWTWTVNISDFAVPFASQDNNSLVDPHIVTTVHSFDLGDHSNLTEAIGGTQDPFCITRILRSKFPSNVTNLYNENNTMNSDCRPVLGPRCVYAILNDNIVTRNRSDPDFGCGYPKTSWDRIPECTDSLGYAGSEVNGFGYNALNLNSNYTRGVDTYESGQGFMGHATSLYNASDESVYEDAINHIQIMMIQTCLPGDGWTSDQVCREHLLCMRVDATMLETNEGESEDDDSGGKSMYSSLSVTGLLLVMISTLAMLL